MAYKVGGSVQLVSRQGKGFTQRFPELAKARQLISRFEWLRARPKRARPKDDVATPPMLMAFDLFELDGDDQRKRPLRERRKPSSIS